jgi:hypothetical protein
MPLSDCCHQLMQGGDYLKHVKHNLPHVLLACGRLLWRPRVVHVPASCTCTSRCWTVHARVWRTSPTSCVPRLPLTIVISIPLRCCAHHLQARPRGVTALHSTSLDQAVVLHHCREPRSSCRTRIPHRAIHLFGCLRALRLADFKQAQRGGSWQ